MLVAHRNTDNEPLFNLLQPSFAPEGTPAFATSSSDDTGEFDGIWLAGADGSQVRLLVRSGPRSGWPEWSPDGRRLAYTDDGSRLCLIDRDRSNKRASRSSRSWTCGPAGRAG